MTLLLVFGRLRAIFISTAVNNDGEEPDLQEIDAESSEILNCDYLDTWYIFLLLLNLF